jgi:hypothetical protein
MYFPWRASRGFAVFVFARTLRAAAVLGAVAGLVDGLDVRRDPFFSFGIFAVDVVVVGASASRSAVRVEASVSRSRAIGRAMSPPEDRSLR